MSGIGGVCNRAGEAIEPGMLNSLAAVLSRRGPDGLRIICDGQNGLVHSHFWVTPEEFGEEQPLVENHLRLVADARIDNRSDLLPVLKKHFSHENPSDAEIILASYREWGEQCPRYLIGDFAFVIWDEDRQRLFSARDPVGIKPFIYSEIDDTLVFGSDIGSILATLGTPPKANIPFIADLLAGKYQRWVHETAFEGIFRLPPAYYLVADSRGVSLKRYWTFGAGPGFHFKTDEEYFSCFRTLFMESVRARSRSTGPIALTVSGGLDSSSIACTMQHLKSIGEIPESCRIYSSVFDHTVSGDERDYLDVVLPACPDFPATLIPADDFWGLREFADDNDFPLDDPETEIIRSSVLSLLRKISQDGCRVVVSGYGGDQVLNTDAYSTPYTLKDVGLLRLPSEVSHFRRYTPHLRELFVYSYITPLFPDALKTHLRRLIPNNSEGMFLTPACIDGVVPPDLLPSPRLPSRTSYQIYSAVNNGLNSVYRATLDTYAAYTGIDWRYPFYDRRIIDFMLSVPPRLSFRKGYSRCILRQSMKGTVPEPVRRRITKAHGGDLQDRGMKERETSRVSSLINNSRAVHLGLVDPARLSRAWDLFRDTEKVPARPLVRYLCAEAWLRHHEKILADQTGP